MAVNLEDPTTWDLDDKELLEMAKAGAVVTEDTPEKAPSVVAPVLAPAAVEPEGAEIQAADGKHTIPYDVLRSARDDARSAKAEVERLRQENEALKTQAPAPVQAPVTPPVVPNELPDDVKKHIESVRTNWGDDIAAQAERTYWLEQHALHQQQVIEQLRQHVQNQQQSEQQAQEYRQRTEAEQIEDAIAARAKAEDPAWFERAVELHAMLLKTDRTYAGQGWHERMKQLPDRVEAVFGASFQKVDTSGVKGKVQSALDMPPTSLSEMSGGSPPAKSELQKIEDLEGNALTDYMAKLAKDPKKFESYLRSLT